MSVIVYCSLGIIGRLCSVTVVLLNLCSFLCQLQCATIDSQSNAHPTGDQEVTGLIPAESGNILSWRLIMKYFLQSFFHFS